MPIKIKTLEELGTFVEQTGSEIRDLKSLTATYQDKIASLQLLVKGGGAVVPMDATGHDVYGYNADVRQAAYEGFEKFIKTTYKKGKNELLSPEDVEFLETAQKNRGGYFLQKGTKADLGTPLVNDSTTGSYLVPVGFHDEILRVTQATSELVPLVMNMPMLSRTKLYPKQATGITFVYVSSDGGDLSEQNPTLGQGTLTSYTYGAWVGLTEALLEDDIAGLGAYFMKLIADAYVSIFETEFLAGGGAPVTGLLTVADTQAVSMGPGNASFSSLSYFNFIAMEAALATRNGALRGARWFMSPSTWNIVRSMVDADGNPIQAPWDSAAPKQILGYNVVLSFEMPDVNDSAASTPFIAFGNPQYLVYGDRVGLETKFFDATQYAITNTEVFFRFRFRAAFDISQAAEFAVLSTGSE